jgi:hypothetical protein
MSRLSIELTPEQHKAVKTLASLEGVAMKQFVWEALQEKLSRHRHPAKAPKTPKAARKAEEYYGAGHDDCPMCRALGPNRRYNKRTEKVLEGAKSGRGMKRFATVEEAMRELRS